MSNISKQNNKIFTKGVASMLSMTLVFPFFSSCKKSTEDYLNENDYYIGMSDDTVNEYYDEYNKKLYNEYLGKYNLFNNLSLDEYDNEIIDLIFEELCKTDKNFSKFDTPSFREYVMGYFLTSHVKRIIDFFSVKKIINSLDIKKIDWNTSVNLNLNSDEENYQNINFGTSNAGGFLRQTLKNKSTYIYTFVNSNTIIYDISTINQKIKFSVCAYINDFDMKLKLNCNGVEKIIYNITESELYYVFGTILSEYNFQSFDLIEFIENNEEQLINIFGEDIFKELKKEQKKLVLN